MKQFESKFGLKKNGKECYTQLELSSLINDKYIPRKNMQTEMLELLEQRMENYNSNPDFNHKLHKLHKIIGAPGSGKTTLLHKIMSYMMGNFANDFQERNKNNNKMDIKKLDRGVMGIYLTYGGGACNSFSDYDKQTGSSVTIKKNKKNQNSNSNNSSNSDKKPETKEIEEEVAFSINPHFLWRLLYEISDKKANFAVYCKEVWKFANSQDLVPSMVGELFKHLFKEFIIIVSVDELNHLPKQVQIDVLHTAAMLHDYMESDQLFHIVCAGTTLDGIYKYSHDSGRQFEDVSCGLFERKIVNGLFKSFVNYWTTLRDGDIRLLHAAIHDTMGFPKFVKILFDICSKYTKARQIDVKSPKSCKTIYSDFQEEAVKNISFNQVELDKKVIFEVLSQRNPLKTDSAKMAKIGKSKVSWAELDKQGIIKIDADGTVYISRLMIAELKTKFGWLSDIDAIVSFVADRTEDSKFFEVFYMKNVELLSILLEGRTVDLATWYNLQVHDTKIDTKTAQKTIRISRVTTRLNVENLFHGSKENMQTVVTPNTMCQFSNSNHKSVDVSVCRHLVVDSNERDNKNDSDDNDDSAEDSVDGDEDSGRGMWKKQHVEKFKSHPASPVFKCRERKLRKFETKIDDSRIVLLVQHKNHMGSDTKMHASSLAFDTTKLLNSEREKYGKDELKKVEFIFVACAVNKKAESDYGYRVDIYTQNSDRNLKFIKLMDQDCYKFFCPIFRNYYLFAGAAKYECILNNDKNDDNNDNNYDDDLDCLKEPPKKKQRTGPKSSVSTDKEYQCIECGKWNPETSQFCAGCGQAGPELTKLITGKAK